MSADLELGPGAEFDRLRAIFARLRAQHGGAAVTTARCSWSEGRRSPSVWI
jgi:hypothetical protein